MLLHGDGDLLELALGLIGKPAVGRVQLGLEGVVEGLELDGVVVEELVDLGQVVSLSGNLCWGLCGRDLLLWERSGESRLVTDDNLRGYWVFEDLTRIFIERVGVLLL